MHATSVSAPSSSSHRHLHSHCLSSNLTRRNRPAGRHPAMRILTINAGSSSMKIALYELSDDGSTTHELHSENLSNKEDPVTTITRYVELHSVTAPASSSSSSSSSPSPPPIRLIIHRVVHGGPLFHKPTLITSSMLSQLESLNSLAPLHNPPAIAWIHAARKAFPPSTASSADETGNTGVQQVRTGGDLLSAANGTGDMLSADISCLLLGRGI